MGVFDGIIGQPRAVAILTHALRRGAGHAYLFSGPAHAVAALTTASTHSPYALPQATTVQCFDLFGNPVPPGALGDERVHYVVAKAGVRELEAARGRHDPMSLDRKRSALHALSEALWSDLAREMDEQPRPYPGDPRRDDDRGGADRW